MTEKEKNGLKCFSAESAKAKPKEKAREMDLLTYLKNYEPQELVHL